MAENMLGIVHSLIQGYYTNPEACCLAKDLTLFKPSLIQGYYTNPEAVLRKITGEGQSER